jgi:hypothetical protein
MLLVELGSRPYPADYFSAKRYDYYELGTRGHNTVLIGGRGQVRGKVGKLLGPLTAANSTTLVGVADGAYEVETSRARRHAAFIDKRFWVLLDEIETAQPQAVELRFHTYGTVTQVAPRRWQIRDADKALDLRVADGMSASVETPDGWIRPVRVLSAKSPDAASSRALITVLHRTPLVSPWPMSRSGRRPTRSSSPSAAIACGGGRRRTAGNWAGFEALPNASLSRRPPPAGRERRRRRPPAATADTNPAS